MTEDVIDRPTPGAGIPRLTRRESIVLRELHRGHTLDEIADRLYVSRNTVKTQVRSLYRKLGVSSRAEAVAMVNQGWDGAGPPRQLRPATSGFARGETPPRWTTPITRDQLLRRVPGTTPATGGTLGNITVRPRLSTGDAAGADSDASRLRAGRPGGPHVSASWDPLQPAIVWVPSCAALVRLAHQRDAAREVLDAIDAAIVVEVSNTRARGANWSDIGGSLGMTRQAVRRRFDNSQRGA